MGMQITANFNTITPQNPPGKNAEDKAVHIPAAIFPKPAEQDPSLLPGQSRDKPKSPDIKQTTRDLEQISLAFNRRLKFEINQESREILIKVIDNETDKVIKVLPPEELQRLHSRIRETMGFLFDQRV